MSQRQEKSIKPADKPIKKNDLIIKKPSPNDAIHSPESKMRSSVESAKKLEIAKKTIEQHKQKEKLNSQPELKNEISKKRHPAAEIKAPVSYTPKQKKAVYKKQIKIAQSHLPAPARVFSKIIHNPAIEKLSDATAKTLFRPSALVGGALFGLIFGIAIYTAAQYFGYIMPNWTLMILLVVGALLGVFLETLSKLLTRNKS